MPNHCINELIFRANMAQQSKIRTALCGPDGTVNFETLVPLPINMWWGSVSSTHKKAFKRTALDWCSENWGTKWNAYEHREIEATDDRIIFVFNTAWRPPYPWLAAIYNTLKISFEHNWLSEGGELSVHGTFDWPQVAKDGWRGNSWKEEEAKDEADALHRRLHKLLWGVERFSDEEAA